MDVLISIAVHYFEEVYNIDFLVCKLLLFTLVVWLIVRVGNPFSCGLSLQCPGCPARLKHERNPL